LRVKKLWINYIYETFEGEFISKTWLQCQIDFSDKKFNNTNLSFSDVNIFHLLYVFMIKA